MSVRRTLEPVLEALHHSKDYRYLWDGTMNDLFISPRPRRIRAVRHTAGGLRHHIDRPPLRLLPDNDDAGRAADRMVRFRGGLAGGALRRVRAYIDAHIGERISLAELARQAGVSRFHFARQFRLSTGKSPMEYLRQVRIERSKSILQTRDSTIAEVAARLGFSDQSHFTRIFGRLVGVPPGSYARCDDWSTGLDTRERA